MNVLRRFPVGSFFALTLALSWAVWVPGTLFLPETASTALLFVGSFGPAAAGAILTKAQGGSLKAWLSDMARFRIGARWWLVAVGLPVALAAVSAVVYATWLGPLDLSTLSRRVPLWLVGLVVISLVGGGNEEPGWRGYALPTLQRNYSALTASLVIGVVWAVWHLPLYVLPGGLYAGRPFLLFAPFVLLFSVVITWFYNSTAGSVPAAMVLHAGLNSANALVPTPLSNQTMQSSSTWSLEVRLVCFAFLALVLVALYGRKTLSANGKQTSSAVKNGRIDASRGLGDPADD